MRKRTALLAIDVQVGAFDGELCPVISGSDQLLANIARLVNVARTSDIEVIFIQHCAPTGEVFEEGTARWQIHPDIGPVQDESIVAKHNSSAFDGTNLHEILQSLGIASLVLCGLQSEHCVSNTALSALGLGYAVTMAQDAHSTWPEAGLTAEQLIERQNALLFENGAILKSSSEVIEEIRADGI